MYYFKLFAVYFKIYETCFAEIEFSEREGGERERKRESAKKISPKGLHKMYKKNVFSSIYLNTHKARNIIKHNKN